VIVVAIVAMVAVPTVVLAGIRWDPRLQVAVFAAAAAVAAAGAAVGWVRYADSRDPHALFVATGLTVVAVQLAVFGVWWPIRHLPAGLVDVTPGRTVDGRPLVRSTSGPAPVYAWQWGWIVAGACFVLARPWWERRGRPAVRVTTVTIAAAVVVAAADLVFAANWRDPIPVSLPAFLRNPTPLRVDAGALSWVLGVLAAGLVAVAAAREFTPHAGRSTGRWLTCAWLLAIPLQAAVVAHPTVGLGWIQPADALQIAVPAIALAALLAEQRTEASTMRRASDRAAQIMEGRAEIASMISHEVRGPVTTIRGIAATSIAHYDRLSDDEKREFLELIEQESQRMLGAVDQTSLALKLDAGSLVFDMRPVELAQVVRAGVEAAGGDPPAHPVHVVAQEDVDLTGDAARLTELVRQLVDNAEKYSPEGAPITVRAVADGETALIEITDRGPGIPPERREEVFGRFVRWRPPGYEEQPGNGLGLFISRGLAAEHQGEIEIEDGPDGGTMLRVRLPLRGNTSA
jgi:signal transduction histidine kinase